jgi:hypothetical protein
VSALRQEITIFREIATKALPVQSSVLAWPGGFLRSRVARTTSDMGEIGRAPLCAIGFVIFAGKR